MLRNELLSKALKENLTQQEIKSFNEYKLSSDDIDFIKSAVGHILQQVKPKPFDCALLSAMLAALIKDHSTIPAAVIAGDFKYKNVLLFKHGEENLNSKIAIRNVIDEKFDGHFWLEAGGVIIDLSIFRTLYSNAVPEIIKKETENRFGIGKGCVVADHEEMIREYNFEYIPRYSLSENTINGLIKGFFEHRLKK